MGRGKAVSTMLSVDGNNIEIGQGKVIRLPMNGGSTA